MLRIPFTLGAILLSAAVASAQSHERFVGEWRSEKSGHHGPMRAKLTPVDGGYAVRIVGRFAAVIPFAYRTHLDVVGAMPEGPILAAEKKLPLFGGSFRTTGVLTPEGFNASYSAMKDAGRFTLARRR